MNEESISAQEFIIMQDILNNIMFVASIISMQIRKPEWISEYIKTLYINYTNVNWKEQ